ncbi:MAG: UDP-2,4-diacetamido-2,4,6-trideoxy-beta-L-altropyranose hydrolase [Crocinitomicaceae bacterium]|nr:UDP-2,4-diacetamido-2,4,6-trideoxy-beta-L-altropyranose hydrolase [Crocinitomicaceae bacterium]
MPRIVFRCDASLSIGSGHVIRCRILARELQSYGAEVVFLCRSQHGDLIALLEKEFRVLPLPDQPLAVCDRLVGREIYAAWLGCSQKQDAEDCLAALARAGLNSIDWLVVDHYGLDAIWESQVLKALEGQAPSRLLVIDDLADRSHQADLLLDQNFFSAATDQRYRGLLPSHCQQLLGPHYALMGSEYAQLRSLVPERTELQRVLVFFGGVDQDNLTCRALEALMDPAFDHLAVDVVLGRQSPHRQMVENLVAQRKFTNLHAPLPSLAALISRADLAIGAGGSTTWERICLRLPSLVVAIAANQVPFVNALANEGHLHLLGESATVTVAQIRSALLSRVDEFISHANHFDLTDGFGASRLALKMLGPQPSISLRPAEPSDKALLLHWASDQQLGIDSLLSELIGVSGSNDWFSDALTDSNKLFLTVTTNHGCPIGLICFDRQPFGLETDRQIARTALLLDKCAGDHGLINQMIRLGLKEMEQCWGPVSGGSEEINKSFACFARVLFSEQFTASMATDCESLFLVPSYITILSDCGSWLNTYLPEMILALWQRGHFVRWIHDPSQLRPGDVCLLLSCGRLLSAEQLALHRHNLVVHASALPQGQGWSPMTWQILDGVSSIPITLFEATAELDAGKIYLQQQIVLSGHELVDEWRALQERATLQLCLEWFDRYKEVTALARSQHGERSHYGRRRSVDSQLDPELSLAEQFNLLRIVDNQSYPAFFYRYGKRFVIKVSAQ